VLEPGGGCPLALLSRGAGALASSVDVWEMESIWL